MIFHTVEFVTLPCRGEGPWERSLATSMSFYDEVLKFVAHL